MITIDRLSHFLKRNTIYRIPQEIHVEAIVNDTVFSRLMCMIKKHPQIMCMLTGLDEPSIKVRIKANEMNDEKYVKLLSERYVSLAKICPVGVHVHLYHRMSLHKLSFREQYLKILNTKQFLESLSLKVADFTPGWWSFNDDTIKACEKLGFKRFHFSTNRPSSFLLDAVKVYTYKHDYDL